MKPSYIACDIVQRRSPTHVLVICACGWRTQVDRHQNALARAAKVRGAIRKHRVERELHLAKQQIAKDFEEHLISERSHLSRYGYWSD